MSDIIAQAMAGFSAFVLVYFLLINCYYLFTIFVSFASLKRYAKRLKFMDMEELISSAGIPPITLVAPAYNEEATCVEAVKSLLTLKFPEYEILVVNDGSKDNTLEVLKKAFDLRPAVRDGRDRKSTRLNSSH